MTNAHALRLQLLQAGYLPIPLFGKAPPQYGKNNPKKGLSGWQKIESVTPEMLNVWERLWPDAENTGALTRTMPTLDADILNEAAAKACEQFVREHYEDAGYVLTRIGKPPKFAIPFRCNPEEAFKKIVVNLVATDGSEGQKIEFLADGEQVVVAGTHPETQRVYSWSNGGLEQIKLEELPYIREAEARALVDAIVEMLCRDFGYKRAPARPKDKQNGAKPHDGGGGGDRDWGALTENILTGRELHDSITIFAAKLVASGMNSGAAVNYLRGLMDKSTAPKDERWHARVSEIPAAVDSAVAKFGKQNNTRSSSGPEAESSPSSAPTPFPPSTAPSPRLRATHNVFRNWLDKEYDIDVLDAVLATAASERLGGDPLWLLVISGSGNAKTETVQALSGAGAHVTSTIASEGALLSATSTSGKRKVKGETGGLLRKLGDRGILVIKDVTTILSTDRHARGPVLAALREIHDGCFERNVGLDGGRTLTWTGRLVIVGAVTTAWDTAHSVIAAMGDRFVVVRADSSRGRAKSATKAIRNTGSETQMRKELAQVTGALIDHINKTEYILSDEQIDQLIKAADIVTAARTGVERDFRGEVIDAHALEMPTRFAKQLGQLVRGAVAIGMPVDDAMRLAIRCARDSIPPLRCQILLDVGANPDSEPQQVHRRLGRPRHTVRRELEALHMLRLLHCDEDDVADAKGKIHTVLKYSLDDAFDHDTLLAMTAPPPKKD
jgi:hypothetical protein